MKGIIGFALIIVGVALGLYAGLWWAFIGGIVQIIDQIRGPELSALSVAIGVARVCCAGAIGAFSAIVCILPGLAILHGD